jgi:hypothetical protein
MTSYFERAVANKIAVEVRTRSPWANPLTIEIPDAGSNAVGIELTPATGYKMLIIPGDSEYVAFTFREFPDGSLSRALPPEGGESLGIPLNVDMSFAGRQIESVLARWRDAEQRGVFATTESAARWFAGLPRVEDLLDFGQFRAALASKESCERYGFALSSDEVIQLLANDASAREYFDAWTARGQPWASVTVTAPSNQHNWLATVGVALVVVAFLAFGSGHFPIPLVGLAVAALGVILSWRGVLRAPDLGGRGYLRAVVATIGGLAFTGWTIYALIALR